LEAAQPDRSLPVDSLQEALVRTRDLSLDPQPVTCVVVGKKDNDAWYYEEAGGLGLYLDGMERIGLIRWRTLTDTMKRYAKAKRPAKKKRVAPHGART
jgi:hypothetical protein